MRLLKLILILLLVVALVPYLITCFYALPFADDYCFGWTASEKISFAHKFLKQYLHWNGRYTSDILVNLHPIITGNLLLCQLTLLSSIVLTGLVLFVFVRQFIKDTTTSIVAALIVTLFYLCYQPDVTEGMYWFIGIANYHLGDVCFVLQLLFFMQLFSKEREMRPLVLFGSLFLLIASVGFNEVGALLIPAYYFIAFLIEPKQKNNRSTIVLLHFVVALVASAFVFFSPGNFTRENAFDNRFNIPHSLLYASLQTVRFAGTWALSVPFVLLSAVVVAKADKVDSNFIKRADYRVILLVLLFTVFAGAFLPYFATGILGQHRTMDYVFFYFILLWLWLLISVSEKFGLYNRIVHFFNGRVVFALSIISIFVIAHSGNGGRMIWDFKTGRFSAYKNEFMQRQAGIILSPKTSVMPLKNIPTTFSIVDVKPDSITWVSECMYKFYTETGLEIK